MIYQECGDHGGQYCTCTCSSFILFFLLTVQLIQMFFSLTPLHSYGNHSSKFLLRINRFGGVGEQTNTQTHSLTSYCFYKVIWYLNLTRCLNSTSNIVPSPFNNVSYMFFRDLSKDKESKFCKRIVLLLILTVPYKRLL